MQNKNLLICNLKPIFFILLISGILSFPNLVIGSGTDENLPVCDKPVGTTLATTDITATFSWTSCSCASGGYQYRYRSIIGGIYSNWSDWTGVAGTTVIQSGLLANTTYQWTVRAVCAGNVFSIASNIKTFNTCGINTFYQDFDMDGYGNASVTTTYACTEPPPGYVSNTADCNDNNSGISPNASEICNGGIDDNCNGLADNADPLITGQTRYFNDIDGDGYGFGVAPASLSCTQPAGQVTDNTDCKPNNPAIHPNAPEICNNNVDDNCNGLADNDDPDIIGQTSYYTDSDGDGYGTDEEILSCKKPDGTSIFNTDCDDYDATINPVAIEICNGDLDDDCDGLADNDDPGVTGQDIYFEDNDYDGYGSGVIILSCWWPDGASDLNTDCDDTDNAINQDAIEICNGDVDDDCNGLADNNDPNITGQDIYYEDSDGDGYGAGVEILSCIAPAQTSTNDYDCDDNAAEINPDAIELCNSKDDNCDYIVDNVEICPKPAATSTTNITNNSATISWTSLPCASSYEYRYRYSISPGVWSAWFGWTNTTDTVAYLTQLLENKTHQWTVRTVCSTDLFSANTAYGVFKPCSAYIFYLDSDSDGYGTASGSITQLCNPLPPNGYSTNHLDCNDANAAVYYGAPEPCDGIDNNCNNSIADEGIVYFRDADGDGYGTNLVTILACTTPAGYTSVTGDCDDNNLNTNPLATELCNSSDDNCDGIVDNVVTCPKPTGLNTSNITATTATISWTAIPCAVNGYQYRLRTLEGGVYSAFSVWYSVSGNSTILSGLLPNKTYQYQVRTACYGVGKYSAVTLSNNFTTLSSLLVMSGENNSIPEGLVLENSGNPYKIEVFPNPTDGHFTTSILSENNAVDMEMVVSEGLGRTIIQHLLTLKKGSNIVETDLTGFPEGIYYLQLRTVENIFNYPLIIFAK